MIPGLHRWGIELSGAVERLERLELFSLTALP